jgi:hypothetical protein
MKILYWIKSLGRVLAFLPVCLFLGVSVNAADLSFEVIAKGDGETAKNGMQVSVHYQGRLTMAPFLMIPKNAARRSALPLAAGRLFRAGNRALWA